MSLKEFFKKQKKSINNNKNTRRRKCEANKQKGEKKRCLIRKVRKDVDLQVLWQKIYINSFWEKKGFFL